MTLDQIEADYHRSGRDVAACMTVDKVDWLIAEVVRLRADIQYALDRLSTEADQGPGLRVLIDEATGRGDYFPSSELKRRNETIDWINGNFANFQKFAGEVIAEVKQLRKQDTVMRRSIALCGHYCRVPEDLTDPAIDEGHFLAVQLYEGVVGLREKLDFTQRVLERVATVTSIKNAMTAEKAKT